MRRKLNWEVSSNGKRIEIIEEVKKLISTHDGSIMNFNLFSDLALSSCIEVEERRISALHHAFAQLLNIPKFTAELNSESSTEWFICIHISFARGTGNLRQSIPKVPG